MRITIGPYWGEVIQSEPFDVTFDLSKVFDLSKPGKYTIEWGCKKVKTQAVEIEIVE